MSKREKIILAIMFFTVIWGGVMLFGDSGHRRSSESASSGNSSSKEKQLIANLASQLSKQTPSKIEEYMVKSAGDAWTKDPFLSPAKGLQSDKPNKIAKSEKQSSPKAGNWLYSGYLEVSGERLAIINGQEYEEGESLYPVGYYLNRIHKNHVTIGIVGKESTITLPLTEP